MEVKQVIHFFCEPRVSEELFVSIKAYKVFIMPHCESETTEIYTHSKDHLNVSIDVLSC